MTWPRAGFCQICSRICLRAQRAKISEKYACMSRNLPVCIPYDMYGILYVLYGRSRSTAHRRAVRIPEQALMREVARRRSSSATMRLHPMLKSFVSDMSPRSVWASHVHTPGEVSGNVPPRARRGCGAQKFVENLSKNCLSDSKFA